MYISNNAYSGLNSLRGGLKHSYWSGSSLLDTTTFQSESGKPSCNYTISRNMQFGFQDTLSMDSNVFLHTLMGNVLVHLSISFLLPIRCPKGYLTKA